VENAFRQPVEIAVAPAHYDAFRECDERLLTTARRHAAKIPFDRLDLLVVDEMGKTISGSGMDLNVIGDWRVKGGKRDPDYYRIVALSLTRGSLGNALGIGLADFTTERLLNDYDPAATYVNLITATGPDSMNTREGQFPLALSTDREAMEVALYTALAPNPPRVCRIHSTSRLDEFWVSEGLLAEVEAQATLRALETAAYLPFDARGNLL